MKYKIILGSFLFISLNIYSQDSINYRIVFYNVENLFHPEDDSLKLDDDFTFKGKKYWSYSRYWKKVNMIAKVLINIGGVYPPDIITLAEIENRIVLDNLISREVLKNYNYQILHRDSPDKRGIDLAFIYRKNKFYPLYSEFINPFDNIKSREIIHVSGIIPKGDTLDIFAVHYPSRFSGYKSSEYLRLITSEKIISKIDSIKNKRANPKIIVVGDFNDEIENESLKLLVEKGKLLHLKTNIGSHKHQGKWATIDNVFISKSLLNSNTRYKGVNIFHPDYLLEKDESNMGKKPFRTYIGFKYNGGFSDHLPIYIDLIIFN